MTFTTITFLVFFVLFFGVYWLLAGVNKNLRNAFMILGGYVFYGWWDWRFLVLLIFSSSIDFFSGLLIGSTENKYYRKLYLWLSLGVNLSLLGFFKYFNFFIDSFRDLANTIGYDIPASSLNIILPVGLSFYTFQSMSYAMDIYYRRLKPTTRILDFFAFVSFFPQLVAGPIERAINMLPQFAEEKKFNYVQALAGLRMMLWGFFKKMVIADTLSVYANQFFADPFQFDSLSAWIGVLAFALQIYCDFSGYSDIAIGTAKILGFDLMVNFRTPYFSKTFTEFWQRWHISLSTWFRDYVFIPLGGNRKGDFNYIINIMITFLLSGLWHGAKYNFILWGLMHGVLLIIDKTAKKISPQFKGSSILVFIAVVLCWVPFRAIHLGRTVDVYLTLFIPRFHFDHFIYPLNIHNSLFLVVFILFVIAEFWINKKTFAEKVVSLPKISRWVLYYLLILCIFLFGDFNNAPSFIYFQF